MSKERGKQINCYATSEWFDELEADALALTKVSVRPRSYSRQDVLRIAHRTWKNLRQKGGAK
jgi:hypothetical protein